MRKIVIGFRFFYYFVMFAIELYLVIFKKSVSMIIAVAALFYITDFVWHYREFNYFKLTTTGVELKKDIDEAKKLLNRMNKMQKDMLLINLDQLEITGGSYVRVNNIYMKVIDIIKPLPNISEEDPEIVKAKQLVLKMYLLHINAISRKLNYLLTGKLSDSSSENIADLKTPEQFRGMVQDSECTGKTKNEIMNFLREYEKVFNNKDNLCKKIIV